MKVNHIIRYEDVGSVPDFEIDGIKREEVKFIRFICMCLLNESRIRNNSNEVGVCVDSWTLNNSPWFYGNIQRVYVRMQWGNLASQPDGLCVNRFVVTHNHPSNSSFSMKDIHSFIANKYISCLIVLRADGGTYILTKKIETSFADAKIFSEKVKTVRKFLKYCESSRSKFSYKYYERRA